MLVLYCWKNVWEEREKKKKTVERHININKEEMAKTSIELGEGRKNGREKLRKKMKIGLK